ncbi:MAG: nucleotide exchange factor GrpE [Deltaproteobacteria bacterium]|nr:MAG: nucleotide exchange factor GrpE [Deltaproteobacteria bacterium]
MDPKNTEKTQSSNTSSSDFSEDEITQSLNEEQLAQEDLKGDSEDISPEAQKLKEVEDKYLRVYAEFDNYRKRVAKEKEDIAFITTQKVFENILEIRDHLEMALSHTPSAQSDAAAQTLKQGIELTLRKMDKFFETFQVKSVDPSGQDFNPSFHEAIQQESSLAHKPGQVVRVFQKGYVFKDRLLRPARVSVAS